jgi:hypothetical protein
MAGRASFSERLVAGGLVLAGLLVFSLSVVLVPPAVTVGQAAAPWTDGAEYLDAAVSFVRDGVFRIHVAGEPHPSRYPFGYSLLVAGALALGVDPAAAPHRVNQAAGLALLLLTAGYLWRRGRPADAGLAVLLLATMPSLLILSRSPLSEVPGTLVAVSGVWLLYGNAGDGSLRKAASGAALLALSVCFRPSNLLLLAAFVPAAAAARLGRRSKPAAGVLALGAAAAAGLVPVLVYNFVTFGSPTTSGYDYWAPYWNGSRAFQLRFIVPNLEYAGRELLERETLFTTANLYGRGSYVGPSFVLLTLLAPFVLRPSRRFWCFAVAGLAYFGLMTTYFFSDARLLFPLFVLAAPVAATGLASTWRRRRGRAGRFVAAVAAVLFLSAVAGWPSAGGGAESVVFLRPPRSADDSPAYRVTRQLLRLRAEAPRLVLTDLPPPYVHALSPPGTLVAPLYDDHLFRFAPRVLVFGGPERRRLVADALAAGRAVWAVTSDHDVLGLAQASPPPAGYAWEIVGRDRRSGGIARLVER